MTGDRGDVISKSLNSQLRAIWGHEGPTKKSHIKMWMWCVQFFFLYFVTRSRFCVPTSSHPTEDLCISKSCNWKPWCRNPWANPSVTDQTTFLLIFWVLSEILLRPELTDHQKCKRVSTRPTIFNARVGLVPLYYDINTQLNWWPSNVFIAQWRSTNPLIF